MAEFFGFLLTIALVMVFVVAAGMGLLVVGGVIYLVLSVVAWAIGAKE